MGNSLDRTFSEHYSCGECIGSGTFCTVKKCKRKLDNKEFAVKIINKNELTPKELKNLRNEISILQTINHLNIIHIEDVFENNKTIKIVLELCEGGNLFENLYISGKHRRFTEQKSAQIIYTLAKTLKYLHDDLNIIHRDLKPENILFTKNGTLKLIDFGSASKGIHSPHLMNTKIGTPFYVAPEVLSNDIYSNKCDLWSLGVILYIMLCGYQPFIIRKRESINCLYNKIINGQYEFKGYLWNHIDKDGIDLIKSLMCIDPNKRISLHQVINNKWILKYVDIDDIE